MSVSNIEIDELHVLSQQMAVWTFEILFSVLFTVVLNITYRDPTVNKILWKIQSFCHSVTFFCIIQKNTHIHPSFTSYISPQCFFFLSLHVSHMFLVFLSNPYVLKCL